jgi:acyl carrier protein
MSTEDRLRGFIIDELHWRGSRRELTDDRRLIADHILDSLGLFELIAFLEYDLGVQVGDEELTVENFATIAAVARLVESKQAGRPAA